jgi:hypothetical protein
MDNTIVIPVNSASEAMAYVDECRSMGLFSGKDYYWRFNPKSMDYGNPWQDDSFEYINNEVVDEPSVSFTFYDENLTSFFRLKWG